MEDDKVTQMTIVGGRELRIKGFVGVLRGRYDFACPTTFRRFLRLFSAFFFLKVCVLYSASPQRRN